MGRRRPNTCNTRCKTQLQNEVGIQRSDTEVVTHILDRQIPFQGDAHHEANAGHQTRVVNTTEYLIYVVLRLYHINNHAAELNEVRNEKVDDVDRSDMIISHLQENIG